MLGGAHATIAVGVFPILRTETASARCCTVEKSVERFGRATGQLLNVPLLLIDVWLLGASGAIECAAAVAV